MHRIIVATALFLLAAVAALGTGTATQAVDLPNDVDGHVHVAGVQDRQETCGINVKGAEGTGYQTNPAGYDYLTPSPMPGASAGNAIDHHWLHNTDGDFIVWDMGTPVSVVDLFPSIDHPPIPGEAIEATLRGSNSLATPEGLWEVGDITTVFDSGFDAGWISDDYVTRWSFSTDYKYIGAMSGGPKALVDDGDAEIDAVCAPAVCDESPISPSSVNEILFPGQSIDIEKCVEVPALPPTPDLFFLFDTTGSMSDDIATAKAKIADIITEVQASTTDPQFGVAYYEDYPFDGWGLSSNVAYQLTQPITGNAAAVTAAVNALSVSSIFSGNDVPESGYEALYQALSGAGRDLPDAAGGAPDGDTLDLGEIAPGADAGFRAAASKVILLIGDSAFHDPGDAPASVQFAGGYPGASEADVLAAQGDVTIICLIPAELVGPGPASQCTDLGAPSISIGASSEDIVDAILAALGQVEVEVAMLSNCLPPISTSFAPPSQVVVSGGVAIFTETISVAASAPGGTYQCVDGVTIDGQLLLDETGAIVLERKRIRVPEGFVTGGGEIDTGNKTSSKRVHASGNVGFLADFSLVGQWNIQFKNVAGTALDGAHFHSTSILALQTFHDGGAGPNPPPANANVALFVATGELNGVAGHTVIVCLADRGEPGSKQTDSLRIFLIDPTAALIYDTFSSGDFSSQDSTIGLFCASRHKLDGGNYQIHSGLKD
jgi:hypothetical protein